MKCWNCTNGIIPISNDDDPEAESYVMGGTCPICQHGKISFGKWLSYKTATPRNYVALKVKQLLNKIKRTVF
jgi:hypothetical protein